MIEIGSVSVITSPQEIAVYGFGVNSYCLCCQEEGRGGGAAATFIQILKTVIRIGDVALDKSVPTPLPLLRYLRHINR